MTRSFALTVSHWREYPCILWKRSKFKGGYGAQYFQGKVQGAHRVAFYKEFGYWPFFACHHCDVSSCIQPYHLYDGKPMDNYSAARRSSLWFRRPLFMKISPNKRIVKPGTAIERMRILLEESYLDTSRPRTATARILSLLKEIK